MELEQKRKEFEKEGLRVAAVSYDSVALLRDFAERKGIHYPLLSDTESRMIRAFGILNENFPPGHPWRGVPFPGTFVVNERGLVVAKQFEEDHRERYTASNLLVRSFGQEGEARGTEVETKHLKLRASSSDAVVGAGSRVALVLDVEMKPRMHVYAPEVQGSYIPVEWKLSESRGWLAHPVAFPAAKILHLPAIHETVPVYEGRFRLIRDLTVGQGSEIKTLVRDNTLTVEGAFRYQACDDKVCYPPHTLPLKWIFAVKAHDDQRAPLELRRSETQE